MAWAVLGRLSGSAAPPARGPITGTLAQSDTRLALWHSPRVGRGAGASALVTALSGAGRLLLRSLGLRLAATLIEAGTLAQTSDGGWLYCLPPRLHPFLGSDVGRRGRPRRLTCTSFLGPGPLSAAAAATGCAASPKLSDGSSVAPHS